MSSRPRCVAATLDVASDLEAPERRAPQDEVMFYIGMPSARMLGSTLPHEPWEVPQPRKLVRGFALAFLTLASMLAGMHRHRIDDRRLADHSPWDGVGLVAPSAIVVFALGAAFIASASRTL